MSDKPVFGGAVAPELFKKAQHSAEIRESKIFAVNALASPQRMWGANVGWAVAFETVAGAGFVFGASTDVVKPAAVMLAAQTGTSGIEIATSVIAYGESTNFSESMAGRIRDQRIYLDGARRWNNIGSAALGTSALISLASASRSPQKLASLGQASFAAVLAIAARWRAKTQLPLVEKADQAIEGIESLDEHYATAVINFAEAHSNFGAAVEAVGQAVLDSATQDDAPKEVQRFAKKFGNSPTMEAWSYAAYLTAEHDQAPLHKKLVIADQLRRIQRAIPKDQTQARSV